MTEPVTLDFLAKQQARILDEFAQMRDDIRVMAAMIQRLDATVHGLTMTMAALTTEVRAEHARFDRLDRRLTSLEQPE